MAEITAAAVKQLREDTGAGMMDCKKALVAAEGDMDAAVEILRKNGQAKAEKKWTYCSRGYQLCNKQDDKTAAIVEVNSETDFAAKTDKFQDYVKEVADQAAESASKISMLSWQRSGTKTHQRQSRKLLQTRSLLSVRTSVSEDLRRSQKQTDVLLHMCMVADVSQ